MRWFDAHLDLAYLAQRGRAMDARVAEINAGRAPAGSHEPAGVTAAELDAAGVAACLATVFTEAVAAGKPLAEPQQYHAGDWAAARRAGVWQIEWYARQGLTAPRTGGVRAGVLIECADVVDGVADLAWWRARGVVAVGLTWVGPGRYAGGNSTQAGITDQGRALVREIDRLGIVHDASHLSEASFWQLLELTDRRIVASHSNCRALLGGGGRGENQRHLSDDQIRQIVRRDGVIGLNLFSAFLDVRCRESGRATIDDCVRHIEHICEIAQSRRHVGLGSDMDGGFSAARLPVGIDTPSDWPKLAHALAARGWSDAEVAGFASGNWERVFPSLSRIRC